MSVVVLGLAVLATAQTARPAAGADGRLVRVAHFDSPVYATAPPGVAKVLYVVEQAGRILVWQNGKVRAKPFLDIRSGVKSGGEQGLLSMAFDPGYARNHFFYVDYTDTDGDTRVVRFRSNGTSAIASSAKQLLFVKDFAPNHNGGQLQFGPDGKLYWGNGDGGGAGDPERNGQNLDRPFAKIERLDVRASGIHWQLVAYGLRNPWRFAFDRTTGDLYIGDVGQDAWEEVDYVPHGSTGVANFGWNHFEGNHVYDDTQQLAGPGRYVPPVYEYSHASGCSVTGGYVYRGRALQADAGRYYFGDNCAGTVWSFKLADGNAGDVRTESFQVPGLSSFAQDAAGELYLMSVTTGDLFRLSQ